MEQNKSIFEHLKDWTSKSISLKLFTIGFIVLILLIPQAFISDLINERQSRLMEVEEEVTQKWSRQQEVVGPYISVPYTEYREIESEKEVKRIKETKTAYFFPEQLNIKGEVNAQKLHRGIFDVAVYTADLRFDASFSKLDFQKFNIQEENLLWKQAKIHIGIADMRGIGENPKVMLNESDLSAEAFVDGINNLKGLQMELPTEAFNETNIRLQAQIKLKGSKELHFAPIGKSTSVHLSGDWPAPSFQGDFLPEDRNIYKEGFEAEWQVLHFNRPYGQEFVNHLPQLNQHLLGLSLKIPVDQYQMSTRTSKYAILIIVLSFLALFMMEIIGKKKIHPLQYILVGLALTLYYTLLIALSEHIGFGLAYLIAALATVLLLAYYTKSVLHQLKNTLIFTSILSVFYLFVYILTIEQDYALLIGSVGLFIALAASMLASRKIDWYKGG